MSDDLIDQTRKAILKRAERPAAERFADMVSRGVIDEAGRVLVRMPEPPPGPGKARRARRHKAV